MEPELFAQIPDDLSALSVEELSTHIDSFRTQIRALQAGDAEIGDRDAEQVLEEARAATAQVLRMQAELGARSEAEQNFTDELEAIAVEAGALENESETDAEDGADGEGDAEGDGEETAAPEGEAAADAGTDADDATDGEAAEGEEQENLAADAGTRRVALPQVPRRHRAVAAEDTGDFGAPLLAATSIRSPQFVIRERDRLDRSSLGQIIGEAWHRAPRNGERVLVASAEYTFADDRRLRSDDPEGNQRKIRAILPDGMSLVDLQASGGLCAPFTPIYDLPIYAVPDTPVENSLPSFGAERGGVTVPTPLGLSAVTDAITRVTAEQDEAGGSDAVKGCVVIDCDPFTDYAIDAIAACVQWGNFNARAWPERVANVADLVAAASAQNTETGILDAIALGSTALADEAKYGAVSTLFQGILKAAAAYRSRHRMRPTTSLRVLLPAWVPDLLLADLAHGQFDRFHARGEIEALLGRAGVTVTWYLDTETGAGQVYGANGATNLDEFKTTVVWYLFAEGTWLLLDGGRIDLGIVRDSGLNSTNDLEVWYERFLGVAKIGIESLRITSTVCPNGAVANPATAFTC